jgi:hypothetical protein
MVSGRSRLVVLLCWSGRPRRDEQDTTSIQMCVIGGGMTIDIAAYNLGPALIFSISVLQGKIRSTVQVSFVTQ